MSHFVPYVDHNARSQLSTMAPVRGVDARPKAQKSFQSQSFVQGSQVKRKALNTVNTRDITAKGCLPSSRKVLDISNLKDLKTNLLVNQLNQMCLKPPQSASDCQKHGPKKGELIQQENLTVFAPQVIPSPKEYPDVEHMPVMEEGDDTFEDIWAMTERPDSYIQEIKDWRPAKIFPSRLDSIEDESSLLNWDMDASLENIRVQDLTVEEPDYELTYEDPAEFGVLLDMPLPPLDDICDDLSPLTDL